jgi:hypothetical protein
LRLGRPTKIHGMHTLKVLTQENMQNTLSSYMDYFVIYPFIQMIQTVFN